MNALFKTVKAPALTCLVAAITATWCFGDDPASFGAVRFRDGKDQDRGRKDRYGDPLPQDAVARLGTHRFRYGAAVQSLRYSPDGEHVFVAGKGSVIEMWNLASGKLVHVLDGSIHHGQSLSFSTDGKRMISAQACALKVPAKLEDRLDVFGRGTDVTPAIWDVATGKLIQTFKGRFRYVGAVCLSPDGKRAISGDGDKIVLWNAESGERIHEFEVEGAVNFLAYSPDGKRVLCGGAKFMELWNLESGKRLPAFAKANEVQPVAVSPDGKRVITSVNYGLKHQLWNVETGEEIGFYWSRSKIHINTLSFSPDGKQVISGNSDGTLTLWEAENGKLLRTFKGNSILISAVCFRPDGKQVLSGNQEGVLALWDVATGKRIPTDEGHSGQVVSSEFSPDGKRILSASTDEMVAIWDAVSGKQLRTFEGHHSAKLRPAFSPDWKRVLTQNAEGILVLWDAISGNQIRTFAKKHSWCVLSVCFSQDGQVVVSGSSDRSLALWDVKSGKALRFFRGHSSHVTSVAFSPGERRILSSSEDATSLVWQPYLSEVREAIKWAEETRKQAETDCKKKYRNLVEMLGTSDYRQQCGVRERILAAGPECLDLLAEVFEPERVTIIDETRLEVMAKGLDSASYGEREKAQKELIAHGARISEWVQKQRARKDLTPEETFRLTTIAKSIENSGFSGKNVGRIRSVLLLIELNDMDRLKPYANGAPDNHATRLARKAREDVVPADGGEKPGIEPRERYLLLDKRLISQTENAELRIGAVKKHPRNPVFGEELPWETELSHMYASVMYDREEKNRSYRFYN